MAQPVFVAGGNTIVDRLISHYRSADREVVSATFSELSAEMEMEGDTLSGKYRWLPGSSLSPRNILDRCAREHGDMNTAFLIYTSGSPGVPLHEVSSVSVQRLLDQKVKSYLFFLKELIAYFVRRRRGRLVVVVTADSGSMRDPLNAGSYGMFVSTVVAALRTYDQSGFQMLLFESESENQDGFLGSIFSTLEGRHREGNQNYLFTRRGVIRRGGTHHLATGFLDR